MKFQEEGAARHVQPQGRLAIQDPGGLHKTEHSRLPQHCQEPHGPGHHQEEAGEQVLLECCRVPERLQADVRKLLSLQQARL